MSPDGLGEDGNTPPWRQNHSDNATASGHITKSTDRCRAGTTEERRQTDHAKAATTTHPSQRRRLQEESDAKTPSPPNPRGFGFSPGTRRGGAWARTRCRPQEVEWRRSAAGIVAAAARQGFPPSIAHSNQPPNQPHEVAGNRVGVGGQRTRRSPSSNRDPCSPPTRRPHGQVQRRKPSAPPPPVAREGRPHRRRLPPPHLRHPNWRPR